jgi:hypothetical protein
MASVESAAAINALASFRASAGVMIGVSGQSTINELCCVSTVFTGRNALVRNAF